jgi:hypothetical protein
MGGFLDFSFICTIFNTASSACRPSDSTVPEDAEIEPSTVATTALANRRSNHSATSHPLSATSHPKLGYISFTLGDISYTLGYISSTLGYISPTSCLNFIVFVN